MIKIRKKYLFLLPFIFFCAIFLNASTDKAFDHKIPNNLIELYDRNPNCEFFKKAD